MSTDLDDERAVLEVVEFSESEDEGFDYKAVEVCQLCPLNMQVDACAAGDSVFFLSGR